MCWVVNGLISQLYMLSLECVCILLTPFGAIKKAPFDFSFGIKVVIVGTLDEKKKKCPVLYSIIEAKKKESR